MHSELVVTLEPVFEIGHDAVRERPTQSPVNRPRQIFRHHHKTANLPSTEASTQRIQEKIGYSSYTPRYANLFEAAMTWPILDLVSNGNVDPKHALTIARDSRRGLVAARTHMEHLMIGALVGITPRFLNLAIAQAAHRGDNQAVKTLSAYLDPLSKEELSLSKPLNGELQYYDVLFATMPKTADEQYKTEQEFAHLLRDKYQIDHEPILASPSEFAQQQNEWAHIRDEILASRKFARQIESLGDGAYWSQIHSLAIGSSESAQLQRSALLQGLVEYHHSLREVNLILAIVEALADFYLGHATPGIPARPAPEHWHWEWREASSQLCLRLATALSLSTESNSEHCEIY